RPERESASAKKGLPEESCDYQALLDDGGLTDNAFAFLFPEQHAKALNESTGLITVTDPNGVRWFEHKGTWLPDPDSFPDETVEETMTPEEKVTKKAISNYMKKRGLKVFFKTSGGKARFMQVYNWRNAGFEFPADTRNKALDAVYGATFTRNKDNPVSGNVTTNSIRTSSSGAWASPSKPPWRKGTSRSSLTSREPSGSLKRSDRTRGRFACERIRSTTKPE
ncbi:hypothetical protein LCGC14_0908740, partial [marine sediment metagenome]